MTNPRVSGLHTCTTRLVTQERSGPSILSWNPAFGANLRSQAENQINKYLPSAYCISSTGGECKEIRHDPRSQITWSGRCCNRENPGNQRFSQHFKRVENIQGVWDDGQRNGTHGVLLLKRSRASYYFKRNWGYFKMRGGRVGRDTRGDAVITKWVLSFFPGSFRLSRCISLYFSSQLASFPKSYLVQYGSHQPYGRCNLARLN